MKKIICANALLILVFAFIQCKSTVPLPVDDENIGGASKKCIVDTLMNTCRDTLIQKEYYHELMSHINELESTNSSLLGKNANLERKLKNLEIDAFLNIQDTTLFGSKFLLVDESSISARSRSFYILIKSIHDLNGLLNKKSTPIESIKVPDRAFAIISLINATNEETLSCLSDSQVEYYRQLIQQYNDLVEKME